MSAARAPPSPSSAVFYNRSFRPSDAGFNPRSPDPAPREGVPRCGTGAVEVRRLSGDPKASTRFRFPSHYKHDHPPVVDPNAVSDRALTLGDRVADGFAALMGSWAFIIVQSGILAAWVVLNVTAWIRHWDGYPFILLNLMLSFQAAYAAPIIMMSQNRQSDKDRIQAHLDYEVNQTAEEEVKVVLQHLEAQNEAMLEVLRRLERLEARLGGTPRDAES